MSNTPNLSRENWLLSAGDLICSEILSPNTAFLAPKYRISVGWPHANKGKHRTILGQCFPRHMSADGYNEIFTTPNCADSLSILATLTHELVHAYLDCEGGHGKEFKKLATAAGLAGKMTATTASPALLETLKEYVDILGDIPHAVLDTSTVKKEKSRQLKLECTDCGAILRASQTVIDRVIANKGTCPACDTHNFNAA
jgi:hypothetical protein